MFCVENKPCWKREENMLLWIYVGVADCNYEIFPKANAIRTSTEWWISDQWRNEILIKFEAYNKHRLNKFVKTAKIYCFKLLTQRWMIAALGQVCTDEAIFEPGATWVNEANFSDETHHRHRIDRSTCRSAAQCATYGCFTRACICSYEK
jgi:hypothetical protein